MISTRTIEKTNGGFEILRILDDEVLDRWRPEKPLAFEKSIVWLQPLDTLDFVRVAIVRNAKSRRGPLLCGDGALLLGFSKLTADAHRDPLTRRYTRRMFYLKDEDFELNMNQFPKNAINPMTILPGIYGDPPDIFDIERGYPWYLCRAGVSQPPVANA